MAFKRVMKTGMARQVMRGLLSLIAMIFTRGIASTVVGIRAAATGDRVTSFTIKNAAQL